MGSEEGGLRVLVVDDHDVVQWGFRLLLERQSWVERCLAASNGDEAVEVCRKVRPEVALVDMLLGRSRAPRSARRSVRSAPTPACC